MITFTDVENDFKANKNIFSSNVYSENSFSTVHIQYDYIRCGNPYTNDPEAIEASTRIYYAKFKDEDVGIYVGVLFDSWGTYDVIGVKQLFLNNKTITYFTDTKQSETEDSWG